MERGAENRGRRSRISRGRRGGSAASTAPTPGGAPERAATLRRSSRGVPRLARLLHLELPFLL
jgi:hypothetical protein